MEKTNYKIKKYDWVFIAVIWFILMYGIFYIGNHYISFDRGSFSVVAEEEDPVLIELQEIKEIIDFRL